MMLSLSEISAFEEKYFKISREYTASCLLKFNTIKVKYQSIRVTNIENYVKRSKKYLSLIKEYKPKIELFLRTETPDYNIFKIIGLDRKEVTTHTPFLANLLSPYETHQHSSKFLHTFLINVIHFSDEDIGYIHDWTIQKEKGYIDLKIINNKLKKAVFIENKIGISAHSGQLSRYFKKWKIEYPNGGAFIYLNINGEQPSSDGFDESIYKQKDVMSELKVLSYKYDIKNWLNGCLGNIESPRLCFTLLQYIDVITIL